MPENALVRRPINALPDRLLAGTAVGVILSCAMTTTALAQSAAPSGSTGAEATSSSLVLDPVTVVGDRPVGYKVDRSASDKFTAPLLDTPKTVTVIPEEIIEERGAMTLEEVFRTTPGITLGAGEGGVPGSDRPLIRGFNAESNVYIDGLRDTGAQTRGTFNLEQVEIVKGPGSAYAGRGATGGSINLVTKTPKAESFVEGSVTAGTDETKRATIDANYAVNESVAVRMNLLGHDGEVAGRDSVEISQFGFAPSISAGLNGPTRGTLAFSHFQTDDTPDYGIPYDTTTGRPADVDRDNFYGLTNRDFRETQADQVTLTLEHDVNDAFTLRNVSRYSWSTIDYIVTNPDDSKGNVANGTLWRGVKSRNSDTEIWANNTELLGNAHDGWFGHSFVIGLEASQETSQSRGYSVNTGSNNCSVTGIGASSNYNCTDLYNPNPNDPWTGSITPSTSSRHVTTDTVAAYVFDTIELTPQWSVNLGLRVDNYETDVESTGGRGGPFTGSNSSTFLNYQGGVVYKPLPNGSIYASIGTSSDPSGASGGEGSENLSASNEGLDPERSISYEVGTKWEVLNRKLALSGAVFRTEKTNARVSDPAGGTEDILDGEQRVDGFELGVAGQLTDAWKVFGGYTFMSSEIVDDGGAGNEGNDMPNVPEHSFSIWSTYDVFSDWTLGGGATYMSSRFGNTANTREVPEFWRFDAMVAYQPIENLTLRLNANNIFDERYFDKPYTSHFATVAPGRSVLLTAVAKF